jgi:hypothetical protein
MAAAGHTSPVRRSSRPSPSAAGQLGRSRGVAVQGEEQTVAGELQTVLGQFGFEDLDDGGRVSGADRDAQGAPPRIGIHATSVASAR